jgi:hypothetical protein
MKNRDCDGFWAGGYDAWWRGLTDAMRAAKQRLDDAQTDEERRVAQDEVEQLNSEHADATQNDERWLF